MREIKFRSYGWTGGPVDSAPAKRGFIYFNVPPDVQQYTGLHDRNGKDIYEGDIVQYDRHDNSTWSGISKHIVLFDGGAFCIEMGIFPNRKASVFLCQYNNMVEVIGNIYESPDLLTANDAKDKD